MMLRFMILATNTVIKVIKSLNFKINCCLTDSKMPNKKKWKK
jgi:hypothetical protein